MWRHFTLSIQRNNLSAASGETREAKGDDMRWTRWSATGAASAALRRALLRCPSLSVARRQSLGGKTQAAVSKEVPVAAPRSQINVDLWRQIRSLAGSTGAVGVLVTEFQMAAFVRAPR